MFEIEVCVPSELMPAQWELHTSIPQGFSEQEELVDARQEAEDLRRYYRMVRIVKWTSPTLRKVVT